MRQDVRPRRTVIPERWEPKQESTTLTSVLTLKEFPGCSAITASHFHSKSLEGRMCFALITHHNLQPNLSSETPALYLDFRRFTIKKVDSST